MSISAEKLPQHMVKHFSFARLIFIIFFSLLFMRLWYLQVMQGDYFRYRSENNRLRTRYLPAPRGFILDRHGKVLVKNRASFNIEIVTEDAKDVDGTIKNLSSLLGIDVESITSHLKESKLKRRRFEPQLLVKDVDRSTLGKVIAHLHQFPGVTYSVVPQREYTYGEFASHLLGYVREISSEQLQDPAFSNYRAGEIVGKFGVEHAHEYLLQGKRGVQGIIVNALGSRIGESYFEPEQVGHNIYLTIDFYLQQLAEDLLANKRGVMLLMSAHTGEIYSMASTPGFDPNVFTSEISEQMWGSLAQKPENRLTNRATQALYPPGSLFKVVMAVAALSEGEITPQKKINCPGYFMVGDKARFRCHKRDGHGHVNMRDAIAHSCNVYFYEIGQRLGIDRIHDYARMFGLGESTGIKSLEENVGTVPSRSWKRKNFKNPMDQRWYPGETPSVSVGQGALRATPLQMARLYAAIVNGGHLLTPSIVKEVRAQQGVFHDVLLSEKKQKLDIAPSILMEIRKSLRAVVEKGTGKRAQIAPQLGIDVAGKTGTAQLRSFSDEDKLAKEESHAWFAGYAPADDPEVVIVTLVETGGHGGETAAPLAKKLLEAYFNLPTPVG